MTGTIGGRLLALREEASLTQYDVAKEVGVTSTTVSNWERDLHEPEPPHLRALARLFGTSPRRIRDGASASDPHAELEAITDQLARLQERVNELRQLIQATPEPPRGSDLASDDPTPGPQQPL